MLSGFHHASYSLTLWCISLLEGMDPLSRRQVWDLINAAKQGRVVILTTHSMEVGGTGAYGWEGRKRGQGRVTRG